MSGLLHDVRIGARMLLKRPGLSALAVLALAIGIGLTATMFSIVYGLILRGLPFDNAERLMHIDSTRPAQGIERRAMSIHDFVDFRAQQTTFEDVAIFYAETVQVSSREGPPIRYLGAYINAHTFDMLGVQPALGRGFRAAEDDPSTPPVMILSHAAWQNRFGGDPAIIGRVIRANSEMTSIVGVMPEAFAFPAAMDAWLPLRIDPDAYPRGTGPVLEGTQLEVVGKLKAGVSRDEAQAEFSTIAAQLEAAHPATNEGVGVVVTPLVETYIGREAHALLYTMLGAVFGVLLIACANVANLLLARTALRTKEIAVRSALGASRVRTVLQLLSETLVLAVAGGTLGLVIATVGIDLFNDALAINSEQPYWLVVQLDPAVIAFVLALTVLSTVLAGMLPAVRASRADVIEVLNDDARGSSSLRLGKVSKALVVAELALSCGLLVAAGLMIRTVVNLYSFDYEFATDNVFTSRVGLFAADYPTEESQQQFFDTLLERLETKPGIHQAALTSHLPASSPGRTPFAVDGVAYPSDQDYPLARRVTVTPGFFDTFDIPLLQGRDFARSDDRISLAVAIVNERFVTRFLPDRDPLGTRIRFGGASSTEPWMSVIGVVPDAHLGTPVQDDHEGIYVPLTQHPARFMTLVARTGPPPMTLAASIQEEVNVIDPYLPLYWVRSMADQIRLWTWDINVISTLFVAFGISALFLATVGLYGVMAFSVSQRTREIGVRMAMGADARKVLTLILKQGAAQLAIGLLLGLGLAAILARLIQVVLFQVEPWDAGIFSGVVVTLVAAGMAACLVPATRATRVDPMVALRYE